MAKMALLASPKNNATFFNKVGFNSNDNLHEGLDEIISGVNTSDHPDPRNQTLETFNSIDSFDLKGKLNHKYNRPFQSNTQFP